MSDPNQTPKTKPRLKKWGKNLRDKFLKVLNRLKKWWKDLRDKYPKVCGRLEKWGKYLLNRYQSEIKKFREWLKNRKFPEVYVMTVVAFLVFLWIDRRQVNLPVTFLGIVGSTIAYKSFQNSKKAIQESEVNNAWARLADRKPGNSGKIEAIQTLAKHNKPLIGIDLSTDTNGGQVFLWGLDVSKETLGHQAHLNEANFSGAWLVKAKFNGADLGRASFNGADLRFANFNGTVLNNTKFNGSDLYRADFTGARMVDIDFRGAKGVSILEGISKVKFNDIGVSESGVNDSWARDLNFAGLNLFSCEFHNSTMSSCNFDGSTFQGCDFKKTTFSGGSFKDATFSPFNQNSIFDDTTFKDMDLTGVTFEYMEMVEENQEGKSQSQKVRYEIKGLTFKRCYTHIPYHEITSTKWMNIKCKDSSHLYYYKTLEELYIMTEEVYNAIKERDVSKFTPYGDFYFTNEESAEKTIELDQEECYSAIGDYIEYIMFEEKKWDNDKNYTILSDPESPYNKIQVEVRKDLVNAMDEHKYDKFVGNEFLSTDNATTLISWSGFYRLSVDYKNYVQGRSNQPTADGSGGGANDATDVESVNVEKELCLGEYSDPKEIKKRLFLQLTVSNRWEKGKSTLAEIMDDE